MRSAQAGSGFLAFWRCVSLEVCKAVLCGETCEIFRARESKKAQPNVLSGSTSRRGCKPLLLIRRFRSQLRDPLTGAKRSLAARNVFGSPTRGREREREREKEQGQDQAKVKELCRIGVLRTNAEKSNTTNVN
jgi:hypothetical protein